jgi:hypothetical protein
MNISVRSDRITGLIFVISSIIFNISIGGLYIAVKLNQPSLVQLLGAVSISTCLPFTLTLLAYWRSGAGRKILLSHGFILFYLLIEILFDYVFQVPFREILYIHIPYIIFFYAATFSMIGVSFKIGRSEGLLVTSTFLMLMACLVYLYS